MSELSADTIDPAARRRAEDIAIVRLLDGRGSVLGAIGTLAGLSPNAVKQRAMRARHKYTADELDGTSPDKLDAPDRRYLARRYSHLKDPGVRRWLKALQGREDEVTA